MATTLQSTALMGVGTCSSLDCVHVLVQIKSLWVGRTLVREAGVDASYTELNTRITYETVIKVIQVYQGLLLFFKMYLVSIFESM